jgi:hypothetical protein
MITYEDCLALADLAPETVERVAAREGLTAIAAVGLASSLAAAVEGEWGGRRTADVASLERAARLAMMPARIASARSGDERLAA